MPAKLSGAKAFLVRQGCCQLLSLCLLIFAFLSIAAIVDLKNASVQHMEVEDLEVDLTRSVPYFSFRMNFQYGSKLSRVEPTEVRCSFVNDKNSSDDFSATMSASFRRQSIDSFQVEVSCSEEDVQPLGRNLWSLVSSYFSSSDDINRGLQDVVRCAMDFDIHFLRTMAIHHTVDLPKDELANLGSYFEEQLSEDGFVNPVENNPDGKNSSSEDGEEEKVEETISTASSEFQVGLETLEATYRLAMPSWVSSMVSRIQLISPTIEIAFQGPSLSNEAYQHYFFPNAMSLLTISGMNVTFEESKETGLEVGLTPASTGSDLIHAQATCSDPYGCPWFGPWIDWYNLAFDIEQGDVDVVAIFSAEGSFLETFFGWTQDLSIEYAPSGGNIVLGRQRELSANFEDRMEDAAKECLGLSDSSSTFNFAVCWTFRFNEGMLFTGDLFLFENIASGLLKTMWDTSIIDTFGGNTTLLVQFGSDGVVMDATGNLFLDWSDLTDISFAVAGTNDGSWYSFETEMIGEGLQLEDSLVVDLVEANLIFEEELLFDATGIMNLDWATNSILLSSSLVDISNGMNCSIAGRVADDATAAFGRSWCTYELDLLWDLSLLVTGDDYDDLSNLKWSSMMTESVAGFLASATMRWEQDFESVTIFLEDVTLRTEEGKENFVDGDGKVTINTSDGTEGSSVIEWNDAGTLGYAATILSSWTRSDYASITEDYFLLSIDRVLLAQDGVVGADMEGTVFVDYYSSAFSAVLEDLSSLDFAFNSTGRWSIDDFQNLFTLVLDQFLLKIDNEVVVDIEGQMDLSANSAGYLYVNLQDPVILEGTADLGFRWVLIDESFTLFCDKVQFAFEQDLITDFEGSISYSTTGMSLFAIDRAELDFDASSNMAWQVYYGSGSDPGFFRVTNATLRSGEDTYMNSTLSMQWFYDATNILRNHDEDPFVISIELNSTDDANLKMGMQCGMEVDYNAETLSMTMDSIYVGWQDETFVSGGTVSSIAPPTTAPTPIATTLTTPSPTTPPPVPTPSTPPPTAGSIMSPTSPPTQSLVSSIPPTEQMEVAQNESFAGLTLPLQGISKELSPASVTAFESSLEDYYEDYYPTSSVSKRLLQMESNVQSFSTTIKVRDQKLTEEGVNVVYDQNITYIIGDFGSGEDVSPMGLIVEPLSIQPQQNRFNTEYLQKTGNSDFDNVTTVGSVEPSNDGGGSSDSSAQWCLGTSIVMILLTSSASISL
ncbi:MAG: hypothetical protein SGILL_002942 [Bacillariaceae sp.]